MGKKRHKTSRKDDLKKYHKRGILLSKTGLNLLDKIAKKASLSKSVLVEEIITGSMAIASSHADKTIQLNHKDEEETTNIEIIAGSETNFKEELEKLQKQLAEEKSHSAQQQENYENLHNQLQQQITVNENLQQQLGQKQTLANQRAASNLSLQQKLEEQATQIQNFEKKVAELESMARIAESQLNRWRKF